MEQYDHRSLGHSLALFHQQEEGPGMVFWHPRGFALFRTVEDYIRKRMTEAGFQEVRTPQVLTRTLWEASGHWEKFGEGIYTLGDADQPCALKPMSCPGHIQIFKHGQRSFRDLPLRLAEFGLCHRNEPSGAILGLMRGRSFVQDDAHIFCMPDQVADEVARFCKFQQSVYADFGFSDIEVGFSTRPLQRHGDDALWDRAEAVLEEAARAAGLDYRLQAGEGAFYGPKLEFVLRDCRGRRWQCGTIQLDFVLPERLDASFDGADNKKARPVVLHQAVLGSLERFIGILLEHHRGKLPLWLAPEQILLATVDPDQAGPAEGLARQLRARGYRVRSDPRPVRLSKKVQDARAAAVPVFLAVGEREARSGTVSLRRGDGRLQGLTVEALDASLRGDAFR